MPRPPSPTVGHWIHVPRPNGGRIRPPGAISSNRQAPPPPSRRVPDPSSTRSWDTDPATERRLVHPRALAAASSHRATYLPTARCCQPLGVVTSIPGNRLPLPTTASSELLGITVPFFLASGRRGHQGFFKCFI